MFRSKGVAARLLIMGRCPDRRLDVASRGHHAPRGIVELTRAGLSDDILLALIEVDQRVFAIDPEDARLSRMLA